MIKKLCSLVNCCCQVGYSVTGQQACNTLHQATTLHLRVTPIQHLAPPFEVSFSLGTIHRHNFFLSGQRLTFTSSFVTLLHC
jgi:hypothetical protein